MALHTVTFETPSAGDSPTASTPFRYTAQVPTGTLISEAAHLAVPDAVEAGRVPASAPGTAPLPVGLDLGQPCGGQGRCGRCAVRILPGADGIENVRRRSTLRLSPTQVAEGYALACQTVVEGDVNVYVPEQEKIERRLTTDRVAGEVTVPENYDPETAQTMRRHILRLPPPRLDDQTDDWSRLQTALRQTAGFTRLSASLPLLRSIGQTLRDADWSVTAIVEVTACDPAAGQAAALNERLVDLQPRVIFPDEPLWGVAIDIGTTTVSLWLVDLLTGEVKAQVAEYNGQIARGEDVISRIIYSGKEGGLLEMQQRILDTINALVRLACLRTNANPAEIFKATVTGNSTMIHLLLGIPAQSIRLAPFITAVNHVPPVTAREVGLAICPEATVDCLPGVASYVGADISAGVFSSGMEDSDKLTLFIDVGTNGEIVLGNREWLVTCACSAGPAFEGAGVLHGMRATRGAIEEVWISGSGSAAAYEPTYRVIGGGKARGLCGSGLIALLAEMFVTGVMDKAGNINLNLAGQNPRLRQGEHGPEYVVAWANQTESGQDIVITNVDIDNLKRAKAAIFAGFSVLGESVGVPLELVEQLLIGGSFGKYINVEKAIQIGLLPDLPWDRIQFLGNTSVRGAYHALLDTQSRQRIAEIASRMTYIELSADNAFYEEFTSAMFFPHTDLDTFPSVKSAMAT